MPTYGPVELERHLPYPMDPAYAWLTDFDEFDHQRFAGYLRERRILEASASRARFEDRVRLLGEDRVQTVEVDLQPPDRWIARVVDGAFQGTEALHELAAAPDGGTLLRVRYTVPVGLLTRLRFALGAGETLEDELADAWDGLLSTMEKELGPRPTKRGP